jgi:hypothetical protein
MSNFSFLKAYDGELAKSGRIGHTHLSFGSSRRVLARRMWDGPANKSPYFPAPDAASAVTSFSA